MSASAQPLRLRVLFILSFTLFLALSPYLSFAAEFKERYCRCDLKNEPEKIEEANSGLWLNKRDNEGALKVHLPWGLPKNPADAENEKLLIQRDYILNYDADLKTPTWAAYRLTAKDVKAKQPRTECFRRDVRLHAKEASYCSDYKEPVFDQGHVVPGGDMTRNWVAMINTYMMSNMAPQHCAFNRGTWQILEKLVRAWAEERKEIYIISGSVFDRDGNGQRDDDSKAMRMRSGDGKKRVAIPSHFYKIIAAKDAQGKFDSITVLFPHIEKKIARDKDGQVKYLEEHITTIGGIEKLTGVTFFPSLSESEASQLKQHKAEGLWKAKGAWPKPLDANCKNG